MPRLRAGRGFRAATLPATMTLAPFESSIAERYHEETKYSEASLRREAETRPQLVWDRQPVPFKRYGGPRILLPVEGLPLSRDGRADPPFPRRPRGAIDLGVLSRLLWHTNGCTRVVRMGGSFHHFRAAPSAGAMYPTELYVAVRDVPGIDPGVYDYQVLDHSLVRAAETDPWPQLVQAAFQHPAFAAAHVCVILTAEWFRSAWRYRERGYRRALLDTGHVLGNLVEYAPVESLRAVPLASFEDPAVERALSIDPVDEGPLVLAPIVSEGTFAELPLVPQHASPATEWRKAAAAVGDRVPENEPRRLAAALQIASRLEPSREGGVVLPPAPPAIVAPPGGETYAHEGGPTTWPDELPVGATIAMRRSTRSFRHGELPRDALMRALEHAEPDEPRIFFTPSLLRTYVVCVRVVGMPPGTYAWDPVARSLVQLHRGNHADALVHLGLGQEIFVDAAAAVIHTVDLTRAVQRYGDRAYRYLGLDAGHIGERLSLALLREGFGASGCGGYYDDEMNRVLGIPESQAVVYITAVGVPSP
ncbi:MAG: hypothetical protein HMLKMBBP_02231 [Planctomycetes bacterium]|nr:hypothetical protein [Planctomycetota bacterium]